MIPCFTGSAALLDELGIPVILVGDSLAMVVLGMLIATVGMDSQSGTARFTFGSLDLLDGLSISALAMGLFGVGEIITSVRRMSVRDIDRKGITFRSMLPNLDELKRSWSPILRGSSIGAFFGALPGTGPSVAAFMSYAVEKRVSREPERFGKGAIEGVVAPESANNAADQTAFIPTMSLGIPGSATMALMLGALMIHGISPGPNLITEQPALFWGLVMSFWIGNVLLVILNLPSTTIARPLIAEPPETLEAATRPSSISEKYSADPKVRA
jgi:TctA family transporter